MGGQYTILFHIALWRLDTLLLAAGKDDGFKINHGRVASLVEVNQRLALY